MTKKNDLNEEDFALFREAMRGVKPITPRNKVEDIAPRPRPKKQRTQLIEPDYPPLSDYEKLESLGSEDTIEFKREGIQHKILRKLRLGQYNVEAILDLHGMTSEEAKEALHRFLTQCGQKGVVHALIIHGKGRTDSKPILKNKLNHWLRQLEQVLAFCSATVKDGRSGAMYVLLKNQKREKNF